MTDKIAVEYTVEMRERDAEIDKMLLGPRPTPEREGRTSIHGGATPRRY